MSKLKKVPEMSSDSETEAFLDTDLSSLEFGQFRLTRFEFDRKDATVTMRLPAALLAAIKERAAARGIPYQRLIREAVEEKLGAQEGAV